MNASIDKKYFLCLDGFRGVCVSWVMFLHVANTFPIFTSPVTVITKILGRICELGFLGVDVFFVISGFLIAGLLFEDLSGNIQLRRFYMRRAFKILPQYFLVVCAGIFLTAAYSVPQFDLLSYLSYFLMIQNYVPSLLALWHLWSIAIEEHFYIILPLLLWCVCRITDDTAKRKRVIIYLFVFLIILGNAVRAVCLNGYNLEDIHTLKIWQQTHIRFDALIFGCLLRAMYSFSDILMKCARQLRGWFFLIGGALAIYLFCSVDAVQWFSYSLIYISAGCLILSGVLGFQPLVLILEQSWLKWIGQNSYGIYLWHFPMLCVIKMWFGVVRWEWLLLIYMVITFILGVGLTQTVERKFLQMRRQLFP